MPSLSKCILSLRGTIIKHDKKDKEVLNTLDEAYLQASRLENEEDSTSKSEIHNELTALLRNYNDLEDRKMAKKRDYVCIAMVVANVVCAWSRYIWETPAPQLLQFLTKLCQIHGNWVHKMTAETLIPTEVIGHEEGLYADMKTRMAKLVEAAACAVSRQSAVSQLSFSPISMCDVTPIISPDICEVRLTDHDAPCVAQTQAPITRNFATDLQSTIIQSGHDLPWQAEHADAMLEDDDISETLSQLPIMNAILHAEDASSQSQDSYVALQDFVTQPFTPLRDPTFVDPAIPTESLLREHTSQTSMGTINYVSTNLEAPSEKNNTSIHDKDDTPVDLTREWNWTFATSQSIVDFLVAKPHAYDACARNLNDPRVTASIIEQQWKRIVTLQNSGVRLYKTIYVDWDKYDLGPEPPSWELDPNYLHEWVSKILEEEPLPLSKLCLKTGYAHNAMRNFLGHSTCFLQSATRLFGHNPHNQPTTQPRLIAVQTLDSATRKCDPCTIERLECTWPGNAPKCAPCRERNKQCRDTSIKDGERAKKRESARGKVDSEPVWDPSYDARLVCYFKRPFRDFSDEVLDMKKKDDVLASFDLKFIRLRWSSILIFGSMGMYSGLKGKNTQQLIAYLTANQEAAREADVAFHDTVMDGLKKGIKARNKMAKEICMPSARFTRLLDSRNWPCLILDYQIAHQPAKCEYLYGQ